MSWEEIELENLCEVTSSKRIFLSEYVQSGIPFYRGKEIIQKLKYEEITQPYFISKNRFDEIKSKFGVPKRGDILLTGVGTIGHPYLVKESDGDFYFKDGNLIWIKENESDIDSSYLFYYFFSPYFKSIVNNISIGSSQKALTISSVKSLKIPIPPLPTQKRIADILSAYDDLIENNLKRIKLLEQAAQNIYKEWFVHLRFPGHEQTTFDEETGLPEGWEEKRFYDVVDIMSGGTPKTREPSYWNGRIPFFTPKDASAINQWYISDTEKTITEEGLAKCNSKLYPIDTIMITARGTVGKVRIVMQPMAMNQSCYALKMKDDSSQYFLLGALNEAVRHLKQTAVGGVFDTIIRDTFKQIPFLQPNKKLIIKYHNIVAPILKQTSTLSIEVSKLKEARDILLPRLMNRTIEV